MRFRISDWLVILALLVLPFTGALQACGSSSPASPDLQGGQTNPPIPNNPPVAVLSVVGPEEGPTPFIALLDASDSFDPDGDEITFCWLFSDGTSSDEPVVNHEFKSSGRHNARLLVTDESGLTDDEGPVHFTGYGLANSPWPKYAHDERNSGLSQFRGPMMDLEHADEGGAFPRYWKGGYFNGPVRSVCVGYDGTVFYTQDSWLRARTADGGVLFDLEADSLITAWPAIAHDGSIILGTEWGLVYRVDQYGELLWVNNVSAQINAVINLDTAINIDGNGTIFAAGNIGDEYHTEGRLVALSLDGDFLWAVPIKPNLYSEYYPPGPLIPAITESGNIVVNGGIGYIFTPAGEPVTILEFFVDDDTEPQHFGPPSISTGGLIAFTHGRLPLFLADGTFYIQLMAEYVHSHSGATEAGWVQAPVWGQNSICQEQYAANSGGYPSLALRTIGGAMQRIRLEVSLDGYKSTTCSGASQDCLGRIYASYYGIHAISPISVSSMFPFVPRRYSMWTYERYTRDMTAPAIGEDGWLYVGCGNDLMAIGD